LGGEEFSKQEVGAQNLYECNACEVANVHVVNKVYSAIAAFQDVLYPANTYGKSEGGDDENHYPKENNERSPIAASQDSYQNLVAVER
jgi:hypothetical protein